ncbi:MULTISPECIES: hypothetical protein [Acetobacteraceae]|uniref:Uncharacterized protein n=3 Tax=Acetobacteraceae TaxID=433 RepID=A0A2S3VXU8_9PROT|nr:MULTISPECIES: hypothetical protein [Acetobacteraceae]POF61415.1 hypothetical protein KMAL_29630 [Novacetimonas maltaceti]BAK84700.1 hypothetical protein GLX_22880 [Komagataeibacter medellinensis NBRC 3288]GAN96441.1 hypothetical protein Geu3261_0069_018 [Komagataeibacter europaeus NBRC 3261]
MTTSDASKIFDTTGFPLVCLNPDKVVPGYAASWKGEMTALLERDTPFALIYPPAPEEDHDDRKERGLWLKTNREPLSRLCRVMILIEPDATRRSALEEMFPGAERAFGVPQMATASKAEAEILAHHVLASR